MLCICMYTLHRCDSASSAGSASPLYDEGITVAAAERSCVRRVPQQGDGSSQQAAYFVPSFPCMYPVKVKVTTCFMPPSPPPPPLTHNSGTRVAQFITNTYFPLSRRFDARTVESWRPSTRFCGPSPVGVVVWRVSHGNTMLCVERVLRRFGPLEEGTIIEPPVTDAGAHLTYLR